MLYKDVAEKLQEEYSKLFKAAIPGLIIDPKLIELSDHGISNGEFDREFIDGGLGICVRELYKRNVDNTQVGYTGKLLGWFPDQFLPEHRHRDILAVPNKNHTDTRFLKSKSFDKFMKHQLRNFIRLENLVQNFSGLVGFENRDYDFFTLKEDGERIEDGIVPKGSILIPGKAETFDIIYGDGSFFLPGEETKCPRYSIPKSQYQYVENKHEIYLKASEQLKLPPNTPHSARAGPRGMVAIEYSMPSRDEADIFTDPRIKRKVEIIERPK